MEGQKLCNMSSMGEMLPIQVQTMHATSQDGLSLKFVTAIAGRECNIQDASGGRLCLFIPFTLMYDVYLLYGEISK